MYKKYIIRLAAFFISLSFFGCKDFIEKNISEDTPVLILPANNDTIGANPVHIKWEELEGATKYRIEVVSPSFSNIQDFPLDSIVSGTNFYFGLDSAQYEIRITAMNAGYSSYPSAIKRFWVGTSQGSGGNGVTLLSPGNETYENEDFPGEFSWNPITSNAVSSYTFELHKTASFAGAYVGQPVNQLAITSISVPEGAGTELAEGVYCWGVKAYFTNGGETNYSKRVFYIDKTIPGSGTPVSPANNATVASGSILFSWTLPTDAGTVQSPVGGKVELSTFANFATIYKSGTSTSNSLTISNIAPGTYYWRVILKDEAGNEGPIPTTVYHTITVQ